NDADAATGYTALFTLTAGQQKTDIDAGAYSTRATLGNFVWNDLNKNGQQDSGEEGLSGVTVKLYNSANQLISNAITDANGKYLFVNLQAGTYYVEFATVPNYSGMTAKDQLGIADDLDSDADGSTLRTGNYTLAAGDINLTVDGGIEVGSTASLEGYAWFDSNADGLQAGTESPVAGIVVQLINGSNQVVAVAITDETGRYYFDNVEVGSYSLNFTNTPTGSTFTQADATGNSQNTIDSDVNSLGRTIVNVTAADATNLDGPDAGLIPPCSVRGTTFSDEGQTPDGLQGATEPIIQGVTVTLYLADGTMVANKATDKNGNYAFTGLTPGSYYVNFENVPSRAFTGKDVEGNLRDDVDSDADLVTGNVDVFSLVAGEHKRDVDAGYVGNGIVFPIELMSFDAEWSNDDALLKWVTKTELNSSHFEIWRSIDDVSYEIVVNNVPAAGTSNSNQKYHTYDDGARLLNVEKLYYRLKMVDLDGSFKWSNTAELAAMNWAEQIYVNLYPNPAKTNLFVDYQLFKASAADLKIVNAVGQVVYQRESLPKTTDMAQQVIDVSKFASGIYYLHLSTEDQQIVKKFVVE
ncbi:MAG: SdrD B-like domain-containing protein, partial [Bacteroidia bacterium]